MHRASAELGPALKSPGKAAVARVRLLLSLPGSLEGDLASAAQQEGEQAGRKRSSTNTILDRGVK